MSSQPQRRYSKRLAATSYDEQDGDFVFTRASKRTKTNNEETPIAPPKKTSRGRPPKEKPTTIPEYEHEALAHSSVQPAPTRKTSRRKPAIFDGQEQDEFAQLILPKRTRRSTRVSTAVPDEQPQEHQRQDDVPQPPAPRQQKASRKKQNGTSQARQPRLPAQDPVAEERTTLVLTTPTLNGEESIHDISPVVPAGAKIALPLSDTPIINRNKEMRKKGGGRRRSSLGMRGRRASSLTSMGHSALPHKEVKEAEFYKHIEAEGLPEPHRMKQLLTWCGERALSAKPPLGSSHSNAILGARAIQDQLLKDFQSKSEFSDWFSREEVPLPPVVLKPNPRNIEHEEKIAILEAKVSRLRELKKTWQALRKSPQEITSPMNEPSTQDSQDDAELLEASDKRILDAVRSPGAVSALAIRQKTLDRLRNIQSTLEIKVDLLADGAHKLEQRVTTAGREADRVLSLSSNRLKDREKREKALTGTKDMPVMEVLRSLGQILPQNG
ncbi:hypothetical protein Cpir12675_004325 [Ceratocystis pirilliformis]|uniref:Kinetochore protein mis13 n=1 Tax=Ceratocystis pirilliformis TaxID=259994 RepID=A0ABR3YYG4_9PEZI